MEHERNPYLVHCSWWLGCILVTLSWLGDFLFYLSGRCHSLWVRALLKWGNRDQLLEYQSRCQDLLTMLDHEEEMRKEGAT